MNGLNRCKRKNSLFRNTAIVVVYQLFAFTGPVFSEDTPPAIVSSPDSGTIKTTVLSPLLTNRDTVQLGALLKPGDALRIVVYPDTQSFLTGTYRLSEKGTIDLPMIGPFRVDTLSLIALDTLLAGHYLRYLRYPFVAATPLVRMGFVGGFGKPGFYYVNPSESFWEALRLSGGPLRQDGLHLMRWERNRTVVSNNMLPAIESGKSISELGIRSGDQFTVTTKLRRERLESFDQDVVPVLQVLLTAITASATLYIVYRTTGGL